MAGRKNRASSPNLNQTIAASNFLFTIFVFGPCEPLIPLLIVPAAQHSWWGVILVSSVFSLTTVATMTGIVLVLSRGIALTPMGRLERWSHALAGFAILACGAGIQWLGF